jgi:hypothetical protein
MLGEGLGASEAEGRAYERVVADLGVGVERQVVGNEREVGAEQRREARLLGGSDRSRSLVPEDAVMAQDHLGVEGGRPLEQVEVGGDAADHELDLFRPRHLKSVGPVVRPARRVEQLVEVGDDLVPVGHGHARLSRRRR